MNAEHRRLIRRLAKEGSRPREMAVEMGVHESTVRRESRRMGICYRNGVEPHHGTRALTLDLMRDGYSLYAIARIRGVSSVSVLVMVRKLAEQGLVERVRQHGGPGHPVWRVSRKWRTAE